MKVKKCLKMKSINLKQICRVCMENLTGNKYKLSETFNRAENRTSGSTTVVLDVLSLFTTIKISEDLPSEICGNCLERIKNVYELKSLLEKSENYFNSLLLQSKIENDDSELSDHCATPIGDDIIDKKSIKESETRESPFNENKEEGSISRTTRSKQNSSEYLGSVLHRRNKVLTSNSKKVKKRWKKINGINIPEENISDIGINEPLICTKCNKTFKTKYILRVHEKRHEYKGQYLCTLCGKGFNSQGCLNRHTRVHTGEKKYVCEICKKRFPSSNNLNIHMRTHTGVKPYLCNLCGKSFSNRTGLNFHVRTHTKEKPYVCDICGKSFGAQSHIDWHRMIHTGERPFPCAQCDKAFIKKCDLQRHEAVHAGLKPYECSFCGKTFRTKMHCQYHTMLHTEERPHKCPTCGKGFIRRYYLKDHIVKHHGTLEGTEFEKQIT